MLKYLVLTAALIITQTLQAQLAVDAKVNLGSLITGGINVQGDFVINERLSAAAAFGYAGNGVEVEGDDYRVRRVRFIPEVRYYLSEPKSYVGADGFFVGGYGKLNRISAQRESGDDIDEVNAVRGALGVFLGNKWVTDGGLVVELNGGIGAGAILGGDATSTVVGTILSTFDARLGILIGYRFGG